MITFKKLVEGMEFDSNGSFVKFDTKDEVARFLVDSFDENLDTILRSLNVYRLDDLVGKWINVESGKLIMKQ